MVNKMQSVANAFNELDLMRMRLALKEAANAAENGEIPVGAVIFQHDKMIGKASNQRETLQDPTAHAEIIALTQAASLLNCWRLENCEMYVTLEPCAMCAGAIVLARLPRLVFGAFDPKAGACGSVLNVANCEKLNHQPQIVGGVLAKDCGEILRAFFRARRHNDNYSCEC